MGLVKKSIQNMHPELKRGFSSMVNILEQTTNKQEINLRKMNYYTVISYKARIISKWSHKL